MPAVKPGRIGQGSGAQLSTPSSVELGPGPLPLQLEIRRGSHITVGDLLLQPLNGSAHGDETADDKNWALWCHKLRGHCPGSVCT